MLGWSGRTHSAAMKFWGPAVGEMVLGASRIWSWFGVKESILAFLTWDTVTLCKWRCEVGAWRQVLLQHRAPHAGALLEVPRWGGGQLEALVRNLLQGSSLGLKASETGESSHVTSGC